MRSLSTCLGGVSLPRVNVFGKMVKFPDDMTIDQINAVIERDMQRVERMATWLAQEEPDPRMDQLAQGQQALLEALSNQPKAQTDPAILQALGELKAATEANKPQETKQSPRKLKIKRSEDGYEVDAIG